MTPAPPAGYIGDAINEATIQPGPNGNFLRIDGPSIDLGNIDLDGNPNSLTINTWVVAGKIAVIDTLAPVITPTPATATVGATNVVASAGITDDLGVTGVTIDLGPIGNQFTSTLNAAQEVPATASTATGTGTFTIDTAANTLSYNMQYSGLIGGAETAAHIHGPAAAGANALPVFDLNAAPGAPGSPKSGVWSYPEAMEADILAGNTYVNVHTTLFPNGEIRGQILPTANVQNMIRTVGTITSGTWSVVIPSVTRVGTFNLPIVATDGSNTANANLVLTVGAPVVLTSVNVAPATATVIVGNTQQLTASPLDQAGAPFAGATVAWSTSNAAVATVDANGLVTGVSVGSATITATATSGASSVTGTSAITVSTAAPVLTSVGVTPATATLAVGGATQSLTASPLDQFGAAFAGATVSWTSSAPTVAAVDATGIVTTVAPGAATITATATSGVVSVTGTSAITVVPAGTPVLTSVSVTPATASVTVGGTQQLSAAALDQTSVPFVGATIAWSSSAPAVATVDANGLVAAVSAGSATITATATSGATSVTGTSAVTVNTPAPPAPPSGGGGGGGGGVPAFIGVSDDSSASFSWDSIEPESGKKIKISRKGISIFEMELEVEDHVSGPTLKVKVLKDGTKEIEDLKKVSNSGKDDDRRVVYQYLSIDDKNLDGSLKGATIKFAVDKSWIEQNDIDRNTVLLRRFSDGKLEDLKTTFLAEAGEKLQFEAKTPGFSTFAVSGLKKGKQVVVEAQPPREIPSVEPEIEPLEPPHTEGAVSGKGATGQVTAFPSAIAGVAVMAVAIAVIGVGAYTYRERRKGK